MGARSSPPHKISTSKKTPLLPEDVFGEGLRSPRQDEIEGSSRSREPLLVQLQETKSEPNNSGSLSDLRARGLIPQRSTSDQGGVLQDEDDFPSHHAVFSGLRSSSSSSTSSSHLQRELFSSDLEESRSFVVGQLDPPASSGGRGTSERNTMDGQPPPLLSALDAKEAEITADVPQYLEAMNLASQQVNRFEKQAAAAQRRHHQLMEQWRGLSKQLRAAHGAAIDWSRPLFDAEERRQRVENAMQSML